MSATGKRKGAPIGNKNAAGDGTSKSRAVLAGYTGWHGLHAIVNSKNSKTVHSKQHAIGGAMAGFINGVGLAATSGFEPDDRAILSAGAGMSALQGLATYGSSRLGAKIGGKFKKKSSK